MTAIAGDVFSAFRATDVDDETATRAAAEWVDIKKLTQEIKEGLGPDSHRAQLPPLDPRHDCHRLSCHVRRRVRPHTPGHLVIAALLTRSNLR
jgi:hypothetical protein